MPTVKAFIARRPVATYFALTFAISWGGILLVIGRAGGIPAGKEQFEAWLPAAIPALLGGPSIACLLLTALLEGKSGLRHLLSRLLTWRVGVRWYAVALLAAPIVMLAELLALSLFSPAFLPGIFVDRRQGGPADCSASRRRSGPASSKSLAGRDSRRPA